MPSQALEPLFYFVRDTGAVFATSEAPTPEDFAQAQVGMVTIIRLADHCVFTKAGVWSRLQRGTLVAPALEGELPSEPFHSELPVIAAAPSTAERN